MVMEFTGRKISLKKDTHKIEKYYLSLFYFVPIESGIPQKHIKNENKIIVFFIPIVLTNTSLILLLVTRSKK